jgi:RNA polymerase sigma-B factor
MTSRTTTGQAARRAATSRARRTTTTQPARRRAKATQPARRTTSQPTRRTATGRAPRRTSAGQAAAREAALRDLAALPARHPARPAVRDEVIVAWLPLAHDLAHRFAGRGEPIQDLVQTATIGLIKAVDRFDAARGHDFASFAVPTIVGEVKRYFRDQGWEVHVPRRLQELRLAIGESTETLAQQLAHSPTPAEVADDLGVPEQEVREGMQAAHAYSPASLDAPAAGGGHESDLTLRDLLGKEDEELARAELRMTIAPAVAALPERQRRILRLRFAGNLTQDQIAAQVGVSQMHVSRLLNRSLRQLRHQLQEAGQPVEPQRRRSRRYSASTRPATRSQE